MGCEINVEAFMANITINRMSSVIVLRKFVIFKYCIFSKIQYLTLFPGKTQHADNYTLKHSQIYWRVGF